MNYIADYGDFRITATKMPDDIVLVEITLAGSGTLHTEYRELEDLQEAASNIALLWKAIGFTSFEHAEDSITAYLDSAVDVLGRDEDEGWNEGWN